MQHLLLSPDTLVTAGVLNDVMVYTFRTLFFLSAILLMVIVLLQEGKGGGLASALGGQGAETFGVSTGGVNKVTLFLAGLFLLSGLAHALSFGKSIASTIKTRDGKSTPTLPSDGGDGGGSGEGTGGGSTDGGSTEDAPVKDADGTQEKAPGTGDGK